MKLNKIDEVWNSANLLSSEFSVVVVIQEFCYHDNCTDVTTSPLYAVCVEKLSKIGHFRVPKTLTFKMRLGAQPFLWKWVLFAWEWKMISVSKADHRPSFWNRGQGELGNGFSQARRSNRFWCLFSVDVFSRGAKDVGSVTGLELKLDTMLTETGDNVSNPSWSFVYVSNYLL